MCGGASGPSGPRIQRAAKDTEERVGTSELVDVQLTMRARFPADFTGRSSPFVLLANHLSTAALPQPGLSSAGCIADVVVNLLAARPAVLGRLIRPRLSSIGDA